MTTPLITAEAFRHISERLFAPSACDHKRMKFWRQEFEGGFYIAFKCPKCPYSGAIHPDQLAEYAKLAEQADHMEAAAWMSKL